MAQKKENIVIVGGSYGGASTAHYLLKHALPQLPDPTTYQVILISPSSQVISRPASPRAMISDDLLDQSKLFMDIPKLFERYPKESFRFVHGAVTALDHANRTVSVNNETIDFHALVIATGSSTHSPLMGLNHNEKVLKERWAEFRKALPLAKNIVIVGGGATGIEVAGELGEHLNGRAAFCWKMNTLKVPITVVTSGPEVLPALGTAVGRKAEGFLAQVGVTVIKDTRVKAVSPPHAGSDTGLTSNATVTLDNGMTLEADLYIPATGVIPNTKFIDSALLASDGRVDTNSSTLRVDKAGPRIYAVGDVSNYAKGGIVNLTAAIPIICANIKRDLFLATGKEGSVAEDRVFNEDTRVSQFVPIGRNKGVGMLMGWQVPSFLVWLIKGRDYMLSMTADTWTGNKWAKET